MYSRAKRRAYEIVERADEDDRTSRIFDLAIVALIAINLLAIVLETLAPLREQASGAFLVFEIVSVAIFTAEYIVRVWSCTEDPAYADPIRGRLRFAVQPLVLIDLVAILPFYIPMFVEVDLRFARALRLLRLFRLIKLTRSESMSIIGAVLQSRREVLLSTVFIASILLFIASSLMYLAERDAQPDGFSSIPAAMWWGMVTLTTVGYGDLFPVTAIGRVLGAIVALMGIGLFALPAGILGSAFVDEIEQRRSAKESVTICPHCGKPLDEHAPADS